MWGQSAIHLWVLESSCVKAGMWGEKMVRCSFNILQAQQFQSGWKEPCHGCSRLHDQRQHRRGEARWWGKDLCTAWFSEQRAWGTWTQPRLARFAKSCSCLLPTDCTEASMVNNVFMGDRVTNLYGDCCARQVPGSEQLQWICKSAERPVEWPSRMTLMKLNNGSGQWEQVENVEDLQKHRAAIQEADSREPATTHTHLSSTTATAKLLCTQLLSPHLNVPQDRRKDWNVASPWRWSIPARRCRSRWRGTWTAWTCVSRWRRTWGDNWFNWWWSSQHHKAEDEEGKH